MRNEIILNNKSSKEITGLLIQELPPISKPMIRTTVEEVDGRDGDIITKLGYSAYNKEISIGLYGDFDINEVIQYFDSEGVVVFSNEPDKYYKYQIIDQIDFERLIRFRTAKVTMHCQPFKYSTTEEPEEFEAGQTTGEGSEIELRPSAVSKINLNAAKGDTEQQTYSGINTAFLNQSLNRDVISYTYTSQTDANISATKTIAGGKFFAAFESNVVEGKTYRLKGHVETSGNRILIYSYKDQGWGTAVYPTQPFEGIGDIDVTFTAEYTGKYVFGVYNDNAVGTTVSVKNIMFGENVESTSPYEPYTGGTASPNLDYPQEVQTVTGEQTITIDDMDEQSQNFTVDLGDIELCKIGTYQDYIFKSSGDSKWYIHKEVKRVVWNGSETWTLSSPKTKTQVFSHYVGGSPTVQYYSNRFLYPFPGGDMEGLVLLSGMAYMALNKTTASTVDQLTTWLASNNVILYYVLATSTDTQITDENLIEQLEALANANSYDGVTHVKSESENKPIILNMSVLSGISCEVTNEGNIYSKPTLTIYGSGTINLSLNNEQMFVIDLGEEDNYVTIDTNAMEAYKDTIDNLMNRSVDGDYNNFKLNIGTNTISWSGNLTKIVIDNYSRWI